MEITTVQHYWDTPKVAGIPGPTTVVVRSRCGQKMNLPAYEVDAWSRKAPRGSEVTNPCPDCQRVTCPECGDMVERDRPAWVDPRGGQRHHDPCPARVTRNA